MSSLKNKINAEQLRAVYRQLPTVITSIVGAGLMLFMLWQVHNIDVLIGWFLAVTAVSVLGLVLYLFFIKNDPGDLSRPYWTLLFLCFVVCLGATWGSIGIIFYDAPIKYQLFVVLWLWAMGAGMSTLMLAHKPAFYIMVTLLLMPLAIRLAMDLDDFHLGLSASTFVWMLALVYFHHVNYKTLLEAINLRFLNVELVSELTHKKKEAEKANLAKSQFLAAASHDLRQPLYAQGLFLAQLDQYVDNTTGRRILGGLESSIYAMRKLLNAILDISKLEAGVVDPHIKSVPISILLHELNIEFESLANEKGVQLRVRKCSLTIETDPALLGSILRNLVANAVRYTENGRVLLGCRRRGKSLVIQVLDTGIGIPQYKQDEIYSPFVQLDNPEHDREKGLGLGLSIVRQTAQLLKHPMTLRSEEGKGSVFSIAVPVSLETTVDLNAEDKSTTLLDSLLADKIKGKRILVIDDDEQVRVGMLGLLKSWGCIPLVIGSVGEISTQCELGGVSNANPIDIILADFHLTKNTTGIQAIEEVRKQARKLIPAALITGDTSVDRLRDAKNSGFPILHKPVLASELKRFIGELVE